MNDSAEQSATKLDPADASLNRRVRRWWLVSLGIVFGVGLLGWWGWRTGRAALLKQTCLDAQAVADWETMEQQAVAWARVDAGSAAPFVYAAEAALAAKAMDRAADYLGQVPDDDPAAVAALLERVDMLFADLAEPLEAAATCRRILTIDPACGPAHQRLAFFYAVTLQRQQLAAQARLAIERGCELPEAYVYLIGSDWITLSNVVRVNQPWLAKHPDEELFRVAIARGEVAARGLEFSLGDSGTDLKGGVVSDLATTMEQFPQNLELLAYFLEEAVTVGDIDRVIELLAQVPIAGQTDNRFWRYKGWLHMARGELDDAAKSFERAVSLNPFDFATRHFFADVARKQGESGRAEQLASLAQQGRQLRRTILEQPDVQAMPLPVMKQIAAFASACGAAGISDRLTTRIGQLQARRPAAGPQNRPYGPPLP